MNIIGNGMVIDPFVLIKELDDLAAKGINITPERLKISGQAHVIMPYHRILDELEETRLGKGGLGTTKRGIGPAYMDKASRIGIRMFDLCDENRLHQRLEGVLLLKNDMIQKIYGGDPIQPDELFSQLRECCNRLRPFVCDTLAVMRQAIQSKKKILCEGAQGSMLDIDYGTYPFVTSSSTTVGGVCTGSGIPPRAVSYVLGITKAYTTRVGGGPFPTELFGAEADRFAMPDRSVVWHRASPLRGWISPPALCRSDFGMDGIALTGWIF